MKTDLKTFTLITGASAGLGKELAIACAKRGMDLILVALPGGNLPRLAAQLRKIYEVQIIPFETDLTREGAVKELVDCVIDRFAVNCLINNAGIGGTSGFLQTPAEAIDRILQLNIRSTVLLTRLLLPELMRHDRSYILSVSSLAAFSPMAYKTVYPASKTFIYHFSRALREELRHTPVSVSVLNPGPILTNFNASRRIMKQGALAKLCLLSTPQIAQAALNGMLRRQAVIIPGWANHLNTLLMQLFPEGIRIHLVSRIVRRELAPRLHTT